MTATSVADAAKSSSATVTLTPAVCTGSGTHAASKPGPPPTGLIGRWTFDAADTDGTQAFDTSGNNYTGRISGSVTRAAGPVGDAYTFANNGAMNMAYALQTELNKNLTLATWIKTTNSSRSEGIISKYETLSAMAMC